MKKITSALTVVALAALWVMVGSAGATRPTTTTTTSTTVPSTTTVITTTTVPETTTTSTTVPETTTTVPATTTTTVPGEASGSGISVSVDPPVIVYADPAPISFNG